MTGVALATEDQLSEAVGLRLAKEVGLTVDMLLRKNGVGYLKTKIASWYEMALNGVPVILLTDLDQGKCAASLVRDWMNARHRHDALIFRVAVREVEAWLLADHVGMVTLLGRHAKLPPDPEALADPKGELLRLAQRAPRSVRNDLIAEKDAMARQGLGYNHRLGAFVRDTWDPEHASERSPSLAGTRRRLRELADRIHVA